MSTSIAPLHILIADGNPIRRELLALLFESNGHHASAFGDGQACLDAMHAQRYDVAVLEVAMPVLGGVETAKAMRAEGADLKIYFYTASQETSVRERFADCDGFFQKGRDERDLLGAVGTAWKPQPEPTS